MKPIKFGRTKWPRPKPSAQMQITINDPDKPRRLYRANEGSIKMAEDKRKAERIHEDRALASELKEVWE